MVQLLQCTRATLWVFHKMILPFGRKIITHNNPISPFLSMALCFSALSLGICHRTFCKILSCEWMLLCYLWSTTRLMHQIYFLFLFLVYLSSHQSQLKSCKQNSWVVSKCIWSSSIQYMPLIGMGKRG